MKKETIYTKVLNALLDSPHGSVEVMQDDVKLTVTGGRLIKPANLLASDEGSEKQRTT